MTGTRHIPDHVLITESALDGHEVALAFEPRAEWPTSLKRLRLFR